MQRDDQAIHFLRGFFSPGNWHVQDWLPQYRDTLKQVTDALAEGDYDLIAKRAWREMDNHIAHAGQGLVSFEQVDQLWEPLKDVLRDIAADGSPESFDRVVATFEQFKQRGQTDKLPMVLIGRAFAALHPDRYHTTVHDRKQNLAIHWFAKHTGFAPPAGNWAARASALCEHLSQWPEFRGEGGRELRNIFPWYVYDRLVRSAEAVAPRATEDEPRSEYSQYERPAQTIEMELRHNRIQDVLLAELHAEYGAGRVFDEEYTDAGGRVDILVRPSSGRPHLYEIKVAGTAAQAAREAIGQLLEYAYRESGLHPERMVIVSEPELDAATDAYLAHLRAQFQLPLYYRQVKLQ